MSTTFDYQGAKKAGYSDEEITQHLTSRYPDYDVKAAKKSGYSPEEINEYLSTYKPKQQEDTRGSGERIKGAASQYGVGVGGGAGGVGSDILQLIKKSGLGGVLGSQLIPEKTGPGTKELSEKIEKEFDVDAPVDSLERILRESGEWGGQEAVVGTATGGPIRGGVGLAHGSASGAFYGGLKELGMGDEWALGLTILATASPLAFQKLLPKIQQKLSGKGPPPPPGTGSAGGGPGVGIPKGSPPPPGAAMQLTPEEAKLTASPQYLKSDFELAEDIQNALSPLKQEQTAVGEARQPATVQRVFEPVNEELSQISPHRINDPNLLGKMSDRIVKDVSNQIYRENTRLWNEARELASEEINARPALANRLHDILSELPPPTRGGDRQLHNLVEQLLNRLERRRGRRTAYRPVSNAHLIDAIKNARVGYNYKYVGGVQGHQVNEFIRTVEDELLSSSSGESRIALERARQAHRDWATRFKHPQVLPFRNEKISTPQANYARLITPDVFNIIQPILEQDLSGKGRVLQQLIRRNIMEKALEPYLMRPQSFNPIKFEREMGKLRDIIPDDMLNQIGNKIEQNHVQSLVRPATPLKGPSFANISESQISSKLKTIEGLRELKKELSHVKGGTELYEQIAKTQGIDLLFGGQLDVPARSERIKKILNDRNGRPYIKETLGEDNLRVLDELVAKNELEKRLTQIEESPTLQSILKDPDILIKGSKVVYNILRGNAMSTIQNSVQAMKKVAKHFKGKSALESKTAESNIRLD